ncbi:MAG: hydrogenase small subunit [Gemmatimonadetes bacterium]|nr:hydrogenase small subunit [Gemmatimonadota bacterium]
MYFPLSHPWAEDETLGEHLERRGVTRRQFLKYCGEVAVMLGLSQAMVPEIARALQEQRRPSVIWLQLQECTGCVESVLRTADPTIGDLLLDLISLDYQHTLMAAAGKAAEQAKQDAMEKNRGSYLLVVTGSIPRNEDGIYLTIGGRTGQDVLMEAVQGAAAVIGIGACAHFGSVQSARPNPTGAVGIADVIRDRPVVNIAGCPPIADVVTATVVHFLTFNRLPELDGEGRPIFAYGSRIHDQCFRRAHYDAGQYVQEFDDDGARKGWCLYQMGCKGPATFSPCPIFQWNDHTDWPIGAGHPCLGCTERHFWDTMTPFYGRLPNVAGFGVERRADTIGLSLALGAAAGVGAHAIATGIHRARTRQAPNKEPADLPVIPTEKKSEEDPNG